MGKMKELYMRLCDEIALREYGQEFYDLPKEEQDEVAKMAEAESVDYLAAEADAIYEREKERRMGL